MPEKPDPMPRSPDYYSSEFEIPLEDNEVLLKVSHADSIKKEIPGLFADDPIKVVYPDGTKSLFRKIPVEMLVSSSKESGLNLEVILHYLKDDYCQLAFKQYFEQAQENTDPEKKQEYYQLALLLLQRATHFARVLRTYLEGIEEEIKKVPEEKKVAVAQHLQRISDMNAAVTTYESKKKEFSL